MTSIGSWVASGDRVVVVSPHLDDAVLSVGASIAGATRRGVRVDVLTVFACDPDSQAPTKGWDARAGFATEGEAARARREEDRDACALLGATPVWLPFGSVDYERHGDESDMRARVVDALVGADAVLVPGSPLTHPDHAWLVRALLASELATRLLGFFAEQPYSTRGAGDGAGPEAPGWLRSMLESPLEFERVPADMRDWLAKRRAVRRYRSQLPLLQLSGLVGLPLERLILSELRRGGEVVAWDPIVGPGGRT